MTGEVVASTAQLDPLTIRVLAPNPSPMTLEGTNTYLLGDPDVGSVIVVDPGPEDGAHLAAVEDAIGAREVAAVLITHHHRDHAEAAGWAGRWSAPLRAFDPSLVHGAVPLRDGEVLRAAGLGVEALHTPGHASDHLCLRVQSTDAVLTGDHVLGRGSTIVNWPDGDMAAYMESLARLARAPGRRVYPGHGPMVEDPAAKVADYIAHRRDREQQVRGAVAAGADSPAAVVSLVYTDVPAHLHPAAERSVRAILRMLADDGELDAARFGVDDAGRALEPSPLAGPPAPPTAGAAEGVDPADGVGDGEA